MRWTRRELKFIVSTARAHDLVGRAGDLLRPDPHADGRATYRVSSRYVDALDLRGVSEKLDGVSSRRKLRFRFYGLPGPGGEDALPGFIELKERLGPFVRKSRARLRPGAARALLDDLARRAADVDSAVVPDQADRGLLAFVRGIGLRFVESVLVSYERHAYLGALDARVRVTIDHDVRAAPAGSPLGAVGLLLLPPGTCVLEVKVDRTMPDWLRGLLVSARLQPRPYSKYAEGVLRVQAARR